MKFFYLSYEEESMTLSIEVVVSENTTKKEKGNLLEVLGCEILEAMQYEVIDEVRITGIEVDLLARHKVNGEEIYVECKAHTDPLSGEVITKLLGNVTLKGVASGWLFSTGPLGKDAKGIKEEWEKKRPDDKRILQIYTPERLLDLLITSGRICPCESIQKDEKIYFSDSHCLLITDVGRFWAIPIIHVTAGVPYAVRIFDAKTGDPIENMNVMEYLKKLDTPFRELIWFNQGVPAKASENDHIIEEAQSIINVSAGDQWADYRPARPQDFVGRKELQKDIVKFLDNVRGSLTTTRLLAIKAPSGWGKSSVLLKLVDTSKKSRGKNKYFIYAVDVRAATSFRYAELSLLACLQAAVDEGFISPPSTQISISNISNPISDQSIGEIFSSLKREGKVIVLFFDQFEEIFSKKELNGLFDSIKKLSSAIDSAQENFVLGFAWKTDVNIPADHSAYYMWHNLADRRCEFMLMPFSTKDISRALTIFSLELGEPLNNSLRKSLSDYCQGYPWLLKKLCIHVYSLIKNGIAQAEVLGHKLNIKELFEKDLSELSPAELACIRKIAIESPADYFKIDENFEMEVIQSLLDRRLVLRKGPKLILYWDIFQSYVLTGEVPQIPVTYIPQTQITRYLDALQYIIEREQTTISDYAIHAKISEKAADNIARDLVMVGNAERQAGKLIALQQHEGEAMNKMADFLMNHVVYKALVERHAGGYPINRDEFEKIFRSMYNSSDFSEKTWNQYTIRLLKWLSTESLCTSEIFSSRFRTEKTRTVFFAQAPPSRVLDVIEQLRNGISEDVLLLQGFRNALSVLYSLDALTRSEAGLTLIEIPTDYKAWMVKQVMLTPTMQTVYAKYMEDKSLKATGVGNIVAEAENKVWTDSSKKRYGGGFLRWAKWIEDQQVVKPYDR